MIPESADALYREACNIDDDPARREEAERLYSRAIGIDPAHALAITNLGNLRYRAGAVREAIALYQRAIAADPYIPEPWYNLGVVALDNDETATAIRAFRIALELLPSFDDALFLLAQAYAARGATAFALHHFRRWLAIPTRNADRMSPEEFSNVTQYARIARAYVAEHERK